MTQINSKSIKIILQEESNRDEDLFLKEMIQYYEEVK